MPKYSPMPGVQIKDLSEKSRGRKKNIHSDLPEIPAFVAFVGPSRSGKSNCIKNLLLRKGLYKGVFEYIFIFCPTQDLSGDYDKLESTHKKPVRKFREFNEAAIEDIMHQQEGVIKSYGKRAAPDILLLLDDCFDDPKFNRSGILRTLAFRGRHAKITTFLSGQKLSMMSTSCRNNLTHMCFFRPGNMNELQFFVDENCEKHRKRDIMELFKSVWKTKYNFVFIDYLCEDVGRKFRKNFSEKLDYEY